MEGTAPTQGRSRVATQHTRTPSFVNRAVRSVISSAVIADSCASQAIRAVPSGEEAITPYAAEVYDHPLHFDAQFPTEPAPGTDTDALAVLNALAHAGRPLTADFLAESLSWNLDRVSDAIERAWAYPHLAGPYALRRRTNGSATNSPWPSDSSATFAEASRCWPAPATPPSAPWSGTPAPASTRSPNTSPSEIPPPAAAGESEHIRASRSSRCPFGAYLSHTPCGPWPSTTRSTAFDAPADNDADCRNAQLNSDDALTARARRRYSTPASPIKFRQRARL